MDDLLNYIETNYNARKVSKYAIGYIHEFYNSIFSDKKHENLEILEIGIHSGNSIRIWSEFFSNSKITCIDIKEHSSALDLKNKKNIECIYADAYNVDILHKLKNKKFDIIIDDGPHTFESLNFFIDFYFQFLNPNGYFILEDIVDTNWSNILLDKISNNVEYKKIIKMAGLQKTTKLIQRWNNGLDVIICKNN